MNSPRFGDSKCPLPQLQEQDISPCPELHEYSPTFTPSLSRSVVLKDHHLGLAFHMVSDFIM